MTPGDHSPRPTTGTIDGEATMKWTIDRIAFFTLVLFLSSDSSLMRAGGASALSAESPPIIDLHFHAIPDWDLQALVKVMDDGGVVMAGNGGRSDSVALSFAEKFPGRFIPFVGQRPIHDLIQKEGEQVWKLESKAVLEYLDQLEAGVRAGQFKGIGELFVNNIRSRPSWFPGALYPADSPLMQRLWAMSATYGVPLSVHMEATEESVAQMERLLASNRQGTWIWAHAGHFGEPPLLRRLFQGHPNLYCELSWREGLRLEKFRRSIAEPIDYHGKLRKEWKELLEEFPERFVIGTDVEGHDPRTYAEMIQFWRKILPQLSPQTAAKIAHQNAERLLKLSLTK